MKIETSDTPLPRSRYQGFIEELLRGKTIINLEHKFYNSIRQACYKQELNLEYRIHTRKQQDGRYAICLHKITTL
tara:strand:- start:1245 stop:1469 length:225 start_codon:yes stop_codon:yes gene_type:complete